MKKFKILICTLLLLPCLCLFTGCEFQEKVYVTEIVQSGSSDTTQTYTIFYSDGSKSTFTVENGKDGQNATLELDALFASLVERNIYTNDNNGYRQFIRDFFASENDNTETKLAINKGLQSAVSVYAAFETNEIYQLTKPMSIISTGSGVIYSMNVSTNESYIITNYHVVYANESKYPNNIANDIVLYQYGVVDDFYVERTNYPGYFTAYDFGTNAIHCDYVGGSMNYDIAVLKAKTSDLLALNPTAAPVNIANSYAVGDTAIAIGNPEGEGISATRGIVSVDSEPLIMTGADEQTTVEFRVMRIDTSVNGGNSGGGLFNINGELIGIVNAKAVTGSSGSNLENMAYALPIDNVKNVVENILYYAQSTSSDVQVKKLNLGITEFETVNGKATYNPTTGDIEVTDEYKIKTLTGGFANDAGLNIGDIITKIEINSSPYNITRAFQVEDTLLNVRVGDTVKITVKTSTGTITWTKVAQAKYFSTLK